jgi:hypothetical protein
MGHNDLCSFFLDNLACPAGVNPHGSAVLERSENLAGPYFLACGEVPSLEAEFPRTMSRFFYGFCSPSVSLHLVFPLCSFFGLIDSMLVFDSLP